MITLQATGKLTSDPVSKVSANNNNYISLDLAVYNQGHTVYLPCFIFGNEEERMRKMQIKKGDTITILGRFDMTDVETKEGIKRKAVKVIIDHFEKNSVRSEEKPPSGHEQKHPTESPHFEVVNGDDFQPQ